MAKKSKSKKKKKQLKRHHFVNQPTQVQQGSTDTPASVEPATTSVAAIATPKPEPKSEKPSAPVSKSQLKDDELADKTALMRSDAKTTFIVGGAIIAVLIVLWVLFEHTGLGDSVYHLINIT